MATTTAVINSGQVRVAGTGAIWRGPAGSTAPTDSVTAWAAGWQNLGYANDGFTTTPNFKATQVRGWQSRGVLRNITTEFDFKFGFELLQTNIATLALAWGNAAITPVNGASLGSVVIATGTGVLTVSAPEPLAVGNPVFLAGVTGGTPLVSGTTYYVQSVLSSTTLTLAASLGGAAIVTSASGTATSITIVTNAWTMALPSDPAAEFALGIDWSDSALTYRYFCPRVSLLTMPTIKSVRTDATRYAFEIQTLIPVDGSQQVQFFGVDAAVAGP